MRKICPQCSYPLTVCLCKWVNPIEVPINIVVLQHFREVGHAKNTVRLAQLAIPSLTVHVIRDNHDIIKFAKQINPETCAVFFPLENSTQFEAARSKQGFSGVDLCVFLDGSWKQAKGMANSMAALGSFNFYSFSHDIKSKYEIRHTKVEGALSTLESIAFLLDSGFHIDAANLELLQAKWQSHWRGPAHHRRIS